MKLKRLKEWASALIDSGLTQCEAAKWKCPESIWMSLSAMWKLSKSDFAHRRTFIQRIRICNACPIYDFKTKRCLNKEHVFNDNGVMRPFGCGCYMPVKAKLKDAECWLALSGNDRWLTVERTADNDKG